MLNFREITYWKDAEILKEGEKSSKLFILKEGNFVVTKIINAKNMFEMKKKQRLMFLSMNSIVGEDGYCFGKLNSYSLSWCSPKSVVLEINSKIFSK